MSNYNSTPFKCERCKSIFGNWWEDAIEDSGADETCPNCGSDEICGNQDDHEENQEATYLCVWGAGFPNSYDDIMQLEAPSFFSTNMGYSTEDIQGLMNLREGEAYNELLGGHYVMRVQDGWMPKEFKTL